MTRHRTFIDVSDLLAWGGQPTGIPRVALSLATRLIRDPDVSLLSYSPTSGAFFEVARERLTEPRPDTSPPRATGPSTPCRRPGPAQRWLRRLRGRLTRIGRRVGAHPAQPSSADTPGRLTFRTGDVVVVLGHGWRPPGLQSALAAHKQRDGIRIVQLIYDLTPVSHPHCYDPGLSEVFASYVSEACSSADGIITISECSKSDLQAFCRERLIPAPPIEVFRLGDDTHLGIDDPAGGIESLHGVPYILSVGSLQARKNHLLLYQAWKLALERGVTLPMLVIVGGTAFGAADTRYAIDNDPAVAGSIRILDHVADRELAWLYRHALFSVLPSVYEGWGLPVAESLAIGKICVASSAGSTPEIGGDLIEYFSPFSAAECLAAIERHLDPAFRREKEAAIRARYVVTSWDASSRQFAEALQRLVGA